MNQTVVTLLLLVVVHLLLVVITSADGSNVTTTKAVNLTVISTASSSGRYHSDHLGNMTIAKRTGRPGVSYEVITAEPPSFPYVVIGLIITSFVILIIGIGCFFWCQAAGSVRTQSMYEKSVSAKKKRDEAANVSGKLELKIKSSTTKASCKSLSAVKSVALKQPKSSSAAKSFAPKLRNSSPSATGGSKSRVFKTKTSKPPKLNVTRKGQRSEKSITASGGSYSKSNQ